MLQRGVLDRSCTEVDSCNIRGVVPSGLRELNRDAPANPAGDFDGALQRAAIAEPIRQQRSKDVAEEVGERKTLSAGRVQRRHRDRIVQRTERS